MNSQRWLTYYSEGNLGFRIHYNKLFKVEYLPGCVRHSQAIFWGIFTFWFCSYYRQNVSEKLTFYRCLNYRYGTSLMSRSKILERDVTTQWKDAISTWSQQAWISQLQDPTFLIKRSLFENQTNLCASKLKNLDGTLVKQTNAHFCSKFI